MKQNNFEVIIYCL